MDKHAGDKHAGHQMPDPMETAPLAPRAADDGHEMAGMSHAMPGTARTVAMIIKISIALTVRSNFPTNVDSYRARK